ncbi:hypothetical protein [Streptomyces sp. P17]|uniref:hypothetical protein n=1 Tax=Streptomyces sp. P17 TaxID=3074716 RepID=UPI0028F44016|nr:hypothetical protein [Streptomyces sp. P17]MDT9698748.1 hypothetical protein [Streptomyces sp. P17]
MEVPEEAVRERRRGRTALLLTGATVLGLVAGTCAGYLVQADREPPRLPSLSQPELRQAKGEGPEPLSASQDRQVRTEGDLRKLLLRKPAGAKEGAWLDGSDGWMDLSDYASTYGTPGQAFANMAPAFRRAAVTGWETGTYSVEIRLIQYRQEESLAAADAVESNQYWATWDGTGGDGPWSNDDPNVKSWTVPGTEDGMAYVHTEPETEPGYQPVYSAEAHAWRGDIAVEIWVDGTEPISKKTVLGLAERQMERL